MTRVIGANGVIRLKLAGAAVYEATAARAPAELTPLLEEFTTFGDAGALSPDVFMIVAGRIIDLSGLATREQIISLARVETEACPRDEKVIGLVARK